MPVALGACETVFIVESSRKGAKRSKKFLASHVCQKESTGSSKLPVGRKIPNRSMILSSQHPVDAVSSSDTSDTIAVNSPTSAPNRGQKRGAASSSNVPVVPGSKRRSVHESTAVERGGHLDNNEEQNIPWFSSSLSRKNSSPSLSFSSRRIRIPGSINGLSVPDLTIDTACDITCVSLLFLKRHPTLHKAQIEPVPPSCMSLSAANGSPLEITGFISLSVTLGDITRRIDALVIPSLGPDQILLDNDVMSRFGAVLDWENQRLNFSSSNISIPATHRSPDTCSHVTPSTVSPSVAAVHKDAETHAVKLRSRINLRPRHGAVITAFTDAKPLKDTEVVIEPRILSEQEMSCENCPVEFERVIVARTLATWLAIDGSVAVQIANPSSESLALLVGLEIGNLSSVAVVSPAQLHVHAVAATPTTPTEIAAARAEIVAPLSKAFVDSTFTVEQQSAILDLCAKYRPVLSLSRAELGKCTTAEATFPLPPNTKPVSRRPYRANPRTEAIINKCVQDMLVDDIIEERSSPWASPVTIVARKDGQPRFCVDYRSTINKHLIRKTWPMANLEDNVDMVGGAQFISVADVQSACWQIPVHPDHVESTAFVTNSGKYCYKRMPFGVCNAPWLFTEMAHKTLGHIPELLVYMDDLCVLSATWENHLRSLESMFVALQAAGLTLKPSKLAFGPKSVVYLGHVISAEGVAVGKDRIKAIQELPTPTCIKDLRSVLGVMNFVRRFVPNFA